MAKEANKPVEEAEVTATEVVDTPTEEIKEEKATAKAGKRSAKGVAEAEEKQAKEERKAHASETKAEEAEKPKKVIKPARPRLERRGKKFREAAKLIEKGKVYDLTEALELAVKSSPVKFDATVELHVNLSVDPKQADQNIRGTVVLPAGTGKNVRIAVFDDAKIEGIDIAGVENVIKALEKGEINFDVLIATPAQMPKLGKYARLLGPRGLMPNPKSGTVTGDVAKAVNEAKAGRVEYRVDSTGIVHVGIGKISFGAKKLEDNARAILQSLKAAKPASVKSNYIKAVHLATTMGPSVTVTPNE
jgi:large subunit ribosomal protein L1